MVSKQQSNRRHRCRGCSKLEYEVLKTKDGRYFCSSCAQNHIRFCSRCGQYYECSLLEAISEQTIFFCESCKPNVRLEYQTLEPQAFAEVADGKDIDEQLTMLDFASITGKYFSYHQGTIQQSENESHK